MTNVHATGLANDLVKTFSKFGTVTQCDELSDYPREPFTQVFLLKFDEIQSARKARRKTDELYFFGSTLHVFYAPEYETVSDTRDKLMKRRLNIVQRLKFLAKEGKRAKSDAISGCETSTSMTANCASLKHSPASNLSGAYSSMSSSNIQNEIKPSLPHIISAQRMKRCHHQSHVDVNGVESAPNSSAVVEHLKPLRKKPKLLRLPGYVPPKNASLASE